MKYCISETINNNNKSGIIDCLARRSHQICSNYEDLITEKEHLEKCFIDCGYPKTFIKKRIDPIRANRPPEDKKMPTVTLPYVGSLSNRLAGLLRNFNVKVFFRKYRTIGQLLSKNSPTYNKLQQKDVVYSIPCNDCDASYIGKTERWLSVRLKEHQAAVNKRDIDKSALTGHLYTKPGHSINWDGLSILQRDNNPNYLLTKEHLLIATTKKTINRTVNPSHNACQSVIPI